MWYYSTMIEQTSTQKHNIGEMVCMCKIDQSIGTIVKFDGLFYKVHWNMNPFVSNNKIETHHLDANISIMKKNLQELLEES